MVQAENYVLRLNAEAYEEELVRRQALPADWTPMDDALNTQLFEVDSASAEVASLVQALQQTGATIVKVSPCRQGVLITTVLTLAVEACTSPVCMLCILVFSSKVSAQHAVDQHTGTEAIQQFIYISDTFDHRVMRVLLMSASALHSQQALADEE